MDLGRRGGKARRFSGCLEPQHVLPPFRRVHLVVSISIADVYNSLISNEILQFLPSCRKLLILEEMMKNDELHLEACNQDELPGEAGEDFSLVRFGAVPTERQALVEETRKMHCTTAHCTSPDQLELATVRRPCYTCREFIEGSRRG